MDGLTVLVVSYAVFALIATLTNLGAQWLFFGLYHGPDALPLAMGLGTIIGLLVKYVLDKRWIFKDASSGLHNHGRKFSLYALMGLVTTAIFWGMEFSFNAMTVDGRFRYLGAALGLAIGYATKYLLDRRFVFGVRR